VSSRRSWWRSGRLIVTVVCIDLLGAGSLAYALTGPSDHRAVIEAPVARAAVHSSVPSPSMSRAPALSARAKTGAAAAAPLDANAQASFAKLRARLAPDARIAIAIQPLGSGPTQILGGDPAMRAMSTSKVLILSALLLDRGGVKHFTAEQKSLARTAITESDNDSILSLFSDLEADRGGLLGASAYATGLLRKAGDDHTRVSTAPPPPGYVTTFGQTPWTPSAEVTFFRALARDCILPRADADYELGLMREIEPSESWGLGSAGFGQVAFKGGWGPEPNDRYGVRQTGIIGSGNSAVVVSIVADPATNFAIGQSVLDQIAQWLRREVRLVPRPRAPCAT